MITRALALGLGVMLAFAMPASAQTWTPLVNQPAFSSSTALLLTDGTVMVQASESGSWWRLTPDNTGSYINGTWSQLASMPAGYGPLYYASAVLPDGRVIVEGGEYNNSGGAVETTLGAIYDPASNSWASIAPPAGWSTIGDAQSVVLANGTFMLANCCTTDQALLNPSSLTWTATGSGKTDGNNEEGWTLLPNQYVLTVDANNTTNLTNSEAYNPSTGIWASAGSTIVKLPDTNSDGSGSRELGPAVLRPDGTVFATGGTSNTAIYSTATGGWSVGPSFPSGIDVADGPAALLPNGNVLVDTSPGIFNPPSSFYEFNGTSLLAAPTPSGNNVPSFQGRMLVLPTGQILLTGLSPVQVYTASGTYQAAWQPTITSVSSNLSVGSANNGISGTQFNGLSQGAAYGDDAQSATNYPLVRITNNATGHVFYARTHNHSTMAVATGPATVSTQFDVPAGIETGASTLQVVANGIPSSGVPVQIVVGQGSTTIADIDNLTTWSACSGQCDGASTSLVSSPVIGGHGNSRMFHFGSATAFGGASWTVQPGINANAVHFDYDFYLQIDTPSASQAEEFSIIQKAGNRTYAFQLQCDFLGTGLWRVWDPSNQKWVQTNRGCVAQSPSSWDHFILTVERVTGRTDLCASGNCVYYKQLWINGTTYPLYYPGTTNPIYLDSLSEVTSASVKVGIKLVGNSGPAAYSTFMDAVKITYF